MTPSYGQPRGAWPRLPRELSAPSWNFELAVLQACLPEHPATLVPTVSNASYCVELAIARAGCGDSRNNLRETAQILWLRATALIHHLDQERPLAFVVRHSNLDAKRSSFESACRSGNGCRDQSGPCLMPASPKNAHKMAARSTLFGSDMIRLTSRSDRCHCFLAIAVLYSKVDLTA